MDFEAVPAGTGPIAALPLRGPDHSIEYLQSDAFHTVLGDATRSVAAVAANTRSSPYSSAGDPDMLACHALLNAMSSRTKSPELPSVLYGTVTVLPTDFTRGAVLTLIHFLTFRGKC